MDFYIEEEEQEGLAGDEDFDWIDDDQIPQPRKFSENEDTASDHSFHSSDAEDPQIPSVGGDGAVGSSNGSPTDGEFNLEYLKRDPAWNDFLVEDVESPRSKEAIRSLIEDIFASLLEAITKRSGFSFRLKSRSRSATSEEGQKWRFVRFPGRNEIEDWKFSCLLRVLELSHEALAEGTVMTKRDIYYKDVQLFKRQEVVDRIVEDLACTFGVERSTLSIVAAAKGIVCGNAIIFKKDGTTLDCATEGEGILIPPRSDIDMIDIGETKWVLVIEKEATFRTLSENRSWSTLGLGSGILVCGKGYPDVSTREFVQTLSSFNPDVRFYGLVDWDPHGIQIFATYKFGSAALKHQNELLAVPDIRHIGVKFRDIDLLLMDMPDEDEVAISNNSNSNSNGDDYLRGMIVMTAKDRRKASLLMGKIEDEELKEELRMMLYTGKKAEIQILGRRLELHLDTKPTTLAFS